MVKRVSKTASGYGRFGATGFRGAITRKGQRAGLDVSDLLLYMQNYFEKERNLVFEMHMIDSFRKPDDFPEQVLRVLSQRWHMPKNSGDFQRRVNVALTNLRKQRTAAHFPGKPPEFLDYRSDAVVEAFEKLRDGKHRKNLQEK